MIVYLERETQGVVAWFFRDGSRFISPPLHSGAAAVRWLVRTTGMRKTNCGLSAAGVSHAAHESDRQAQTVVRSGSGCTEVVDRNTTVVRITDQFVELNTGGWFTFTTKTRMNQASHQFQLGYYVYQRRNAWCVDYAGVATPFPGDSIRLPRKPVRTLFGLDSQ